MYVYEYYSHFAQPMLARSLSISAHCTSGRSAALGGELISCPFSFYLSFFWYILNVRLFFRDFSSLFALFSDRTAQETEVELDEVECSIANLIQLKLVKGYLSHDKRVLVLSKKDPFPPISSQSSQL